MANLDELFGEDLGTKLDFLNDKRSVNSDGIYRIDLTKVRDKKRGYRSVIRLLPNLTKEGVWGQSAIEKISHYVDIKNVKELSGYFDSPKNFGENCDLTNLYYAMQNSKNAIQIEKSKCLKFSKKYYSYAVILEDEQQPELVGKTMIFQYGKTIRDKILAEKNGEISGVGCNVFDWTSGKDFVLLVKEIQTGPETYPDYKSSMFKQELTSLPVYNEEKKVFKNVPITDGKIESKYHQVVKDFLLNREHELEDYAAKKLTDEQHGKITEITNFLTGKASSSFASKPSADDFDMDEVETDNAFDSGFKSTGGSEDNDDDDDFFKGL